MKPRGWVAYRPGSDDPRPVRACVNGGPKPEFADVGRLLRRGVRKVVAAARADEQVTLPSLLMDHLGVVDTELAVVEETWPPYDQVNVQAGIDAWRDAPSRSSRLVGVIGFQHHSFGLADLLGSDPEVSGRFGPRPGNVAWVNLACGPDGQVRPCVRCGLYLVTDGDHRSALLLRAPDEESGGSAVDVQIVSTAPDLATRAAADIRRLAVERNVFRHQVLSFGGEVFGRGKALLQFHARPSMDSSQLILDPETLAAVRRQVVEVARHKKRLLAARQHLKRGVLLYGPPGVGKTHTVRFLVSSLIETTVIQLTGNALHLIAEACSVARTLQPAMVVVEDVDLIAEDRGRSPGHHPLLFQLLNEMDGLAEDCDVVFVLTTNRPDLLEPALAARPGRVDQAVQLTLPDRSARRQLFELYRGGLQIQAAGLERVLQRTEGVTASFLKELLRRSAVLAAERASDEESLNVSRADLNTALDELLETRNSMTRVLLGSPVEIDQT